MYWRLSTVFSTCENTIQWDTIEWQKSSKPLPQSNYLQLFFWRVTSSRNLFPCWWPYTFLICLLLDILVSFNIQMTQFYCLVFALERSHGTCMLYKDVVWMIGVTITNLGFGDFTPRLDCDLNIYLTLLLVHLSHDAWFVCCHCLAFSKLPWLLASWARPWWFRLMKNAFWLLSKSNVSFNQLNYYFWHRTLRRRSN